MKDDLISDIKEWIEQIEKKQPNVPKDLMYFNVSYNQMLYILKILEGENGN